MIQPIHQVNGIHVSTVTRVAFGELRRFASFITKMAAQSQSPIDISQTMPTTIPPPKHPATAAAWSASLGDELCASKVVAENSAGSPNRSRFIWRRAYRVSPKGVNAISNLF